MHQGVDQALERLEERAAIIDRAGQRLERLLVELGELEHELERLDEGYRLPNLPSEVRAELRAEIELSVGAYNHLRSAAEAVFRQLVLERERCGFRGHEVLERCYDPGAAAAARRRGADRLIPCARVRVRTHSCQRRRKPEHSSSWP
jgi:predicted nuclease with TOPRIM domain